MLLAEILNTALIKKAAVSLQGPGRLSRAAEKAAGAEYGEERETVINAAEAITGTPADCIGLTLGERAGNVGKAFEGLRSLAVSFEIKDIVRELFCRELIIYAELKGAACRLNCFGIYAFIAAAFRLITDSIRRMAKGSGHKPSRKLPDDEELYECGQGALKAKTDAPFLLGLYYEYGLGTAKDLKKAFCWYQKSAEGGNPAAARQLVRMYYKGDGTDKNYKRALECFERSDSAEDKDILRCIGQIYRQGGCGADKNYLKAAEIFENPLFVNDVNEQALLCDIYLEGGYGIERDIKKAAACIDREDFMSNPQAAAKLMIVYMNYGPLASSDYKRKLLALFNKSCENGVFQDFLDEIGMGLMHLESGFGVERDYNKAFKYFRAAAEAGIPIAYIQSGKCCENGWGVKRNKAEADRLYKEAFKRLLKLSDSAESKIILGQCCQLGRGTKQSYAEAFRYYSLITDQENAEYEGIGQYSLAYLYENGCGVERDCGRAFDLYMKAYGNGSKIAPYRIACLYDEGLGCAGAAKSADMYKSAFDRLRLEMQMGNEYAKYYLAECYEYGRGCKKNIDEAVRIYKESAADESNFEIKERARRKLAELHEAGAQGSPAQSIS